MLRIESYRRGLAFSTAFNAAAKILLFLQNVLIAYYFGAQLQTDLYFFIYATLTYAAFFINSLDASVLIPEAMRINEQRSRKHAMKFLNFFILAYLLLGLFTTAVFMVWPVELFNLISNFNTQDLSDNLLLLLSSVPVFLLLILVNLLSGILAAWRYFTMPVIVATVNSLIALLFIILFHDRFDVASLTIGLVIANLINLIFLLYLMKQKLNWNFMQGFSIPDKTVRNDIVYAQTGNGFSTLSLFVPVYLLSGFGSGVITAVTMGQRTAEVPANLINTQFTSLSGIRMNEINARNESESLNSFFCRTVMMLTFIIVPVSAGMFYFAPEIITLLFKRGAFGTEEVMETSFFLRLFSLTLPLQSVNMIVSRLYSATRKVKVSAIMQISVNVLLSLLIILTLQYGGAWGFPISMIISLGSGLIVNRWILKKLLPQINYPVVLTYLLKILLVNFMVTGLIWLMVHKLSTDPLILISLAAVINLLFLILLNHLLHLNPEVDQVTSQVLKKFKLRHRSGKGPD